MASQQLSGSRSKSKRKHVDLETVSSSDDESETTNLDSWPRFLVVQGIEGQPLKLNPFAISKAIAGICGEVKNVTRLRTGSLLVECARKQQAVNLLKARQFANTRIDVSPHRTLNSCRGIVRDRAKCLSDMSEVDIAAELKSQGVTSVKRFTRKDGDNTVKTNTYLLTFCLATVPKSIKAGYFNIEVEVYIPNPLRCFKCQLFGHGANTCKNSPKCSRCGEKHENADCTNAIKCANCHGDHMSSSRSCPVFEQQAQMLKLKHTNNISFAEAKKLLPVTDRISTQKTYSAVVSTSRPKVDHECQTSISWVSEKQNILYAISDEDTGTSTQTDMMPEPKNHHEPERKTTMSRKEQKQLRRKEARALKHIEVPLPLQVPVEVHNTYEPLDMETSPSQSSQHKGTSSRSRSPIEPP
ncbi:uncharacterized protein [Haliotis asinina]|uniref:uncharacterized protein n=1 Tax=Haliotis asinina TaxID=109174 RepID=UPI0035320F70